MSNQKTFRGLATGSLEMTDGSNCFISHKTGQTDVRRINLTVTCPGASFFKLSESPDFKESPETGITIAIENEDPEGKFVDVSINYPNGVQGGNGDPFTVTSETRTGKVLVVLFDFENNGSGLLGAPSYATPTWADKVVFKGGFDGKDTDDSLKAYIEQNSFGRVMIEGEVYPEWIYINPVEKYRDPFLRSPQRVMMQDVVDKIIENDPTFFDGKDFDFLIGFIPGGILSTGSNFYDFYPRTWPEQNGIFEGFLALDIPVESTSILESTIVDEVQISYDSDTVITRLNPKAVSGVWLASDTLHEGTNYFTGGIITSRYQDSSSLFTNYFLKYLKLGTPLPENNTEVIVTYNVRAWLLVHDIIRDITPPDTLWSRYNWFGVLSHEYQHAAAWTLSVPPTYYAMGISDIYQVPWETTRDYDMMSSGNYNQIKEYISDIGESVVLSSPSHHNPSTKIELSYMTPYTLRYGENEHIRIYKAEEDDYQNTGSRIKAVKVPLRPAADVGFWQLVGNNDETVREYAGEEYLLLELRYKGELENGLHNFDKYLLHQGLLIYHQIDGEVLPPPEHSHGWDQTRTITLIDATPVEFPVTSLQDYRLQRQTSIYFTPAPFGSASGVYQYTASELWNWKKDDSVISEFLLSDGKGVKTVYAKFMDVLGNVIENKQIDIVLGLGLPAEGEITVSISADSSHTIDIQTVANGGTATFYVNVTNSGAVALKNVVIDDSLAPDCSRAAAETALLYLSGPSSDLDPGESFSYVCSHSSVSLTTFPQNKNSITVSSENVEDATDNPSASDYTEVLVNNEVPIADAGTDQIIIDSDGDGFETVTLDGSLSRDPDGEIVTYQWFENGLLISTGQTASVSLARGIHNIMLLVTDNDLATRNDNVSISVVEGYHDILVTKSGSGDGVVISDPSGIDCGSVCEYSFSAGTNVSLIPNPDEGSVFSGWSGDCSGSPDCFVYMTDKKIVDAVFDLIATPPLTAPTNLKGEGISTSEIRLTWDDSNSFEDGFYIERTEKLTKNAKWVLIDTVDADTTTYIDTNLGTGLFEGSTYYYQIRAFNENEFSEYSNIAKVKTCKWFSKFGLRC